MVERVTVPGFLPDDPAIREGLAPTTAQCRLGQSAVAHRSSLVSSCPSLLSMLVRSICTADADQSIMSKRALPNSRSRPSALTITSCVPFYCCAQQVIRRTPGAHHLLRIRLVPGCGVRTAESSRSSSGSAQSAVELLQLGVGDDLSGRLPQAARPPPGTGGVLASTATKHSAPTSAGAVPAAAGAPETLESWEPPSRAVPRECPRKSFAARWPALDRRAASPERPHWVQPVQREAAPALPRLPGETARPGRRSGSTTTRVPAHRDCRAAPRVPGGGRGCR